MSLAVAAAALDRALKGSTSTMYPPELPPPPLHLHRKSFSTFRENTSSNVRSVSPSPHRVRRHCEVFQPQSKYENFINSGLSYENNYTRTPFFEAGTAPAFRRNVAHAKAPKSANVSFVGLYKNYDRHQTWRNDTAQYRDKFYSIPRFPFRGMSFDEKCTYPHRNIRIRSSSLHSSTFSNESVREYKDGRSNSQRGLHGWSDIYEVESKLGPSRLLKKSFMNSTRKKNFFPAEQEKDKERPKFEREPSCPPQGYYKHFGNCILHNSKDSRVTKRESPCNEPSGAPNLEIDLTRGTRQKLVNGGLRIAADKSELKTKPDKTCVKLADRADSKESTNNSSTLGGSVVNDETENLAPISSVDVVQASNKLDEVSSYTKNGNHELFCNRSVEEQCSERTKQTSDNNGSQFSCSDDISSPNWGNQQSLRGLEQSDVLSFNPNESNIVGSDPPDTNCSSLEILEFRSICEERNGNIVVKPDIASEILKECFSSSDCIEDSSKPEWWNTDGSGLEVDTSGSTKVGCCKNEKSRTLSEQESDLMFDFIYHSETEGFKSSSPKKIPNCFTHTSFDERDNEIVVEKHTRRKTESILSSIKSSRKKLLEAGTTKIEQVSEPNVLHCTKLEMSGSVDSKESSHRENRKEVETVDAECEKKIGNVRDSGMEENLKTGPQLNRTTATTSESCVLSVSLSGIGPPMTTRWRNAHSETASNFKEEFQGYHSCEKFHSQESKYKTELCRAFQIRGSCRYGSRCNYAHGLDQLKVSFHHGKYKTRNCQAYHESGYCRYGARCSFIHDLEEGILKCSIANKEILEALHHWPEEESAVDRSATVTWRVFTGCSKNDHNETMLEFAAIPSLRPADIDTHNSSMEDLCRATASDGGMQNSHEQVTQSSDYSQRVFTEHDNFLPTDKSEPVDSVRMESLSDDVQKSFVLSDFSCKQKECPGKRPSIKNNVNDLLALLRSVETESFAIHRSYSQSNRDLNQQREMKILSRFPCSRQSDLFSKHDFYNCRARISSQRCGNSISLLDEESLGDCNHPRTEFLKKKKKCFSFHHKGFCLYGADCLFIHDE